jgi:outer membrane translocation and assembly module TamA
MQYQFPAVRFESAHAVTNTLRFHRQWEGSSSDTAQLDAGYNLRAATNLLGSHFGYARHAWNADGQLQHGNQTLGIHFGGGVLLGRAPFFERFTAGNASTLRGWSQEEIAPLGGNRMAQGTVEYRYRVVEIFCDSGSVWDHGASPEWRTSLGAGLRRANMLLAVAFPLRAGRADPVFLAGMNF